MKQGRRGGLPFFFGGGHQKKNERFLLKRAPTKGNLKARTLVLLDLIKMGKQSSPGSMGTIPSWKTENTIIKLHNHTKYKCERASEGILEKTALSRFKLENGKRGKRTLKSNFVKISCHQIDYELVLIFEKSSHGQFQYPIMSHAYT